MKDEHALAAELEDLKDEIVMLTARAELAEEDAAAAWGTCVDVHTKWAKRGGDPDFADRRAAFLTREETARRRLENGRAQ